MAIADTLNLWRKCLLQTQSLAASTQVSSRGAARVRSESALSARLVVFPLALFAGFGRVKARPDYRAVTAVGYQEIAACAV